MSLKNELGQLLKLAAPLSLFHLGSVLTGAVDTAVVGRLGESELGAVGLGNAVFFTCFMFGTGIMLGLSPLISQAVGAGEHKRAHHLFAQGRGIALVTGVLLSIVMVAATLLLGVVGVSEEATHHTTLYMVGRGISLVPMLWMSAGRSFLQSHHVTWPMVTGVIVANLLNAPLSWLLVHGDPGLVTLGLPALGVPQLGTLGAGVVSSVASMVQVAFVYFGAERLAKGEARTSGLDFGAWRECLRLGFPIGLHMLAEVGVFALASFVMAALGDVEMAAHQVAITVASLAFVVSVGLGEAGTVQVGRAIGEGESDKARRAGFLAFGTALVFGTCVATLFALCGEPIALLFTDNTPVVALATSLLMIAGVFQLSDATQAVMSGVLRGAGDTKSPMILNLVGHYLVGAPIGVGLGLLAGWGATGLWWGLTGGLSVVGVGLVTRFFFLSRKGFTRVS